MALPLCASNLYLGRIDAKIVLKKKDLEQKAVEAELHVFMSLRQLPSIWPLLEAVGLATFE
jgi:hypothetical protein